MDANNKIFVTSVSKAVSRATATGKLSMTIPRLYHLYGDMIKWIEDMEFTGDTRYTADKKLFKDRRMTLKYRYPNEICNYKTVIGVAGYTGNQKPDNGLTTTAAETTPTLNNTNISLVGNETHVFTYQDFINNYSDPSGGIPDKLIIYISSTEGSFTFDNNPISGTFEFNISNVGKLVYTRPDGDVLNTSFNFRVINNLDYISALVTTTVTGTSTINEPATIGDHSMTVDNNVITVLTMAMFLETYSDPEGDLLDAIRIDSIQTTNTGTFYLDGIPIIEGQIILREDIELNKFTHTGVTIETIATDSFAFSVRDEGSGIWVS